MKKRLCLAVLVMAISSPAMAQDECEIDQIMRDKRVAMNKHAKSNVDQGSKAAMDGAANIKDGSCLPIMDTLDSLMRMRIPSIGGAVGGAILSKMKDMACETANDALTGIASRAKANIGDPYGIVSIGVGTTSGQGGAQIETYDFGKVLMDAGEKAVSSKVGDLARSKAGDAVSKLPNGIGDRNPKKIENTAEDAARGAVNEAIKGL